MTTLDFESSTFNRSDTPPQRVQYYHAGKNLSSLIAAATLLKLIVNCIEPKLLGKSLQILFARTRFLLVVGNGRLEVIGSLCFEDIAQQCGEFVI